ncbi:hypothetical protein J9253_13050 [Thiothrix litoralis]|uniref:Cysteine-rich secretory protein family protein n=1 Tax=Thiothrix litoralis TaxID=2891210 RepID=A0ABX7WPA1_9GAMM|nr:CAP domain-containing protein [Thiothrix litoralis]QTR44937.1 hypothetical protein J9253_13050 [Thiothrix litoralis]
MARVLLSNGESFNIVSDNVEIVGNIGSETVTIFDGAPFSADNITFDQSIERIEWGSGSSGYQFQQTGNVLRVYNLGGDLIATVPVDADNSLDFVFSNGKTDVNFEVSGINAGKITVGGEAVATIEGGKPLIAPVFTDYNPVFSLTPLTTMVAEGDAGEQTQAIGIVVNRNGHEGDLTVNLRVTESAPVSATAGVDFVGETIPVIIYAGSSLAAVDVAVLGDRMLEGSETFIAELVEGSQSIGDINALARVATITIIDDDVVVQPVNQPTSQEQFMLELLNRARLNPADEAALFGIGLNEGLTAGTLSSSASQPLAFNNELTAAARSHSEDMLDNDFFAHVNLEGQSPFDRIQTAGYTYVTAGENIGWIGTTASLTEATINTFVGDSHESLFVDEGVVGRGHRVNMLDDSFKEVGIGIHSGEFTSGATAFNSVMSTQNFATQPNAEAFLLGVIYKDADNNRFYTPGEGIGSVGIVIVNTLTNATQTIYSMDAGGYQVELDAGIYDITYTFNDNAHFIDDLVIGVDNIKSDWVV